MKRPDCNPNEPQRRQAHGSRHTPHLTVASFPNRNFEPARWDERTLADWWVALPQIGRSLNHLDARRQGRAIIEQHATTQVGQGWRIGEPLDLY